MDHAADTMPKCAVTESIDVHPDEERPAYQVFLRDEAPVAAVPTVVTIVAHHEIFAGRDLPLTLATAPRGLTQHLVFIGAEFLITQLHAPRIGPGVFAGCLTRHHDPIDIQRFIPIDNIVARL